MPAALEINPTRRMPVPAAWHRNRGGEMPVSATLDLNPTRKMPVPAALRVHQDREVSPVPPGPDHVAVANGERKERLDEGSGRGRPGVLACCAPRGRVHRNPAVDP